MDFRLEWIETLNFTISLLTEKILLILNKVDHFKVKLRLPLVYQVGFSIKGDGVVGGEVLGVDGGEIGGMDG